MRDSYRAGFRGRIANYIKKFLIGGQVQGKSRSGVFNDEIPTNRSGTGKHAVTHFALKMNSLTEVVSKEVFAYMFVDDILIAYAHHNHQEVEGKR